jgi:tRNA 2-thiocytidine biosynthesis protein TtcA
MLRDWDQQYPKRLASIFSALQNVSPSQLADRDLFDFESLQVETPLLSDEDVQQLKQRLDVVNLSLG